MIKAANIGNIPGVYSKYSGKLKESGAKVFGQKALSVNAPEEAVSYKYLCGTGQKGDFEHFSFINSAGRIIQNFTRYISEFGNAKDVITNFNKNKNIFNVDRKTIDNGKETNEFYSFIGGAYAQNGTYLCSRSFMTDDSEGQNGGLLILRNGEKPIGVSFDYNWDGKLAEIKYINTQGKTLDLTNEELMHLPFIARKYKYINYDGKQMLITEDFTDKGVQDKINLAQIIQEKFHDIEGILPEAKAVKFADLHLVKTSGMTPNELLAKGLVFGGETLGNGQTNIAVDLSDLIPNSIEKSTDGLNILVLMAHEMQHVADYINMYRGGDAAYNEAVKNLGMNVINEWNESHNDELEGLEDSIKAFKEKIIAKKGPVEKGTPEFENAVRLYEMNYKTTAAKDLNSQAQHDEMPLEKRAIARQEQQMEEYKMIMTRVNSFFDQFLV